MPCKRGDTGPVRSGNNERSPSAGWRTRGSGAGKAMPPLMIQRARYGTLARAASPGRNRNAPLTGLEQHMAKYADVEEYLDSIADSDHRDEFNELLNWVHATWPQLVCEIKWNQPMFTDHGTFIIGFTALTNYVTVGSEPRAFEHAVPLIEQQHLKRGKKTFQIPYGRSDAWEVLEQIIDSTIADKRDVQTFWDQRRSGY